MTTKAGQEIEKYKIGNIDFSYLPDHGIIEHIDDSIERGKQITIAHANFHFVIEAQKHELFRCKINRYALVQPDGIGVRMGMNVLFGDKDIGREIQTGTDFYYKLMDYADSKARKVYFLGSTIDVLRALGEIITAEYPRVRIVGFHHGYFDMNDGSIVKEINAAEPDIVMIGMGVPRQELWLHDNVEQLNAPVLLTVGAGLEFLSKMKRRAPKIMRMLRMEWVFRLLQEPFRLWKRYILGIPRFCFIILKQKIFQ